MWLVGLVGLVGLVWLVEAREACVARGVFLFNRMRLLYQYHG